MRQSIMGIKCINDCERNSSFLEQALIKTKNSKLGKDRGMIIINSKPTEDKPIKYSLEDKKGRHEYICRIEPIFLGEWDQEDFYKSLEKICDESVQAILKIDGKDTIPKEEYESYKTSKSGHKAVLHSIISYKWTDKNIIGTFDIFDMATEIFIRFCQSHFLSNANKRFAAIFTAVFLAHFNFYIIASWHNETDDHLQRWLNMTTKAATQNEKIDSMNVLAKSTKFGREKKLHEEIKETLLYYSYFKLW